jgi:hypothetical protein
MTQMSAGIRASRADDEDSADRYAGRFPGAVTLARSCRYFTIPVVRYVAGEAGIRDFPGIGPGMPLADPVREVAKRAAPDDVVSVGYAGNDPLMLTRARALLTGPPGATGHLNADLNDPGTLLKAGRYPSGRRARRPLERKMRS